MLALIVLLAAGEGASTPRDGGMSTGAAIEHRCAAAARETHKSPGHWFADVGNEDADWRAFRDRRGVEHARADGEAPQGQARVWLLPDGLVLVGMVVTSDSGDWVQFSDQCFRPDGTIARTTDTLNTFQAATQGEGDSGDGGVSRVRIIDWSPAAVALQKRSRLLDIQTHKPVKGGVSFQDEKDLFFRRLSDLPFYSLLTKVSRPGGWPPPGNSAGSGGRSGGRQ